MWKPLGGETKNERHKRTNRQNFLYFYKYFSKIHRSTQQFLGICPEVKFDMKEHAKKALKHDTKVLGKTVPTMILAGLFLVGGGSAAILSSFGTVTGDAVVEQSVTIDGKSVTSSSGPTVEASYDPVVGGGTVASHHVVRNNFEDPIEVTFDSSQDEGGVTGSNVLYLRYDNDGDGSYDVEASQVDSLSDGDYAVHLEGDSTVDYATVYFPVSGLSSADNLRYDAETLANHDAGGEIDEVYLREADGTKHSITEGSVSDGKVTVDLSKDSVYDDGSAPSSFGNIVSVGIGYGDASNAFEGSGTSKGTVNVTVDNVEVGDSSYSNIDEVSDSKRYLFRTGVYDGTMNGYDLDTEAQYGLLSIGAFDTAIVPDTYTVSTGLTP